MCLDSHGSLVLVTFNEVLGVHYESTPGTLDGGSSIRLLSVLGKLDSFQERLVQLHGRPTTPETLLVWY